MIRFIIVKNQSNKIPKKKVHNFLISLGMNRTSAMIGAEKFSEVSAQ